MNIKYFNPEELLELAVATSNRIEATFTEGLDIHLEKDAYTKFEYELEMDRISVKTRRCVQQIHEISDKLINEFATHLPESITNQMICNDTTNDWYGKCECCGNEIIDGVHPVEHYPYYQSS